MIRAISCLVFLLLAAVGCNQTESNQSASSTSASQTTTGEATPPPTDAGTPGVERTTRSGIKIQDLKVGDGAIAESGKTVSVHYTGWLTDGTKFDSSLDRGQPFPFVLGTGAVIPGWDEGVQGMRVGGKRKLTIPPDLAYGASGTPGGPIPPNATLVFECELMGVQ